MVPVPATIRNLLLLLLPRCPATSLSRIAWLLPLPVPHLPRLLTPLLLLHNLMTLVPIRYDHQGLTAIVPVFAPSPHPHPVPIIVQHDLQIILAVTVPVIPLRKFSLFLPIRSDLVVVIVAVDWRADGRRRRGGGGGGGGDEDVSVEIAELVVFFHEEGLCWPYTTRQLKISGDAGSEEVYWEFTLLPLMMADAPEVGASVLQRGGQAVDAAVVTALCLDIVNPMASGIGGEGFMIVRSSATSQTQAFDMRETAPLAATEATLLKAYYLHKQKVRSFSIPQRRNHNKAKEANDNVAEMRKYHNDSTNCDLAEIFDRDLYPLSTVRFVLDQHSAFPQVRAIRSSVRPSRWDQCSSHAS
ncbi:hypothetical protein RJ640_009443 [Escallonia rubra]|uniref:Uncharacterized protein n=1 Tax=Escallonia rubra TaxID=112253 RepID=A0AA88QT43_9ASTE|nr:hypothetical protein RJ640_009443 [Escallonia rubra]